jgi:hypothetical protein
LMTFAAWQLFRSFRGATTTSDFVQAIGDQIE